MKLGFSQACRAGISFGKDDLVIPPEKWTLVGAAQDKVKEYEQQYQDGLITQGEKIQQGSGRVVRHHGKSGDGDDEGH